MKTSFDRALSIATAIAAHKSAELTALSFQPLFGGSWMAYFGSPKGTSHVEIEGDTHFDRHLEDYDTHFSAAGEPAKEILERDGERLFVEIGDDLVIVTRRNLGPYDNSAAGCQVDMIIGNSERIIRQDARTHETLGSKTFYTYALEDFEFGA